MRTCRQCPRLSKAGCEHPEGLPTDLVVSLPGEVQAPAKGVIPYVRYLAKLNFSEDKWIIASQTRPGNRAVVHHMAITELALDDGVTPADLDSFHCWPGSWECRTV